MQNNKESRRIYPENRGIRELLGRGHINVISKCTGYSKDYVVSVLIGRRNNSKIVSAALMLIESRKDISDRITLVVE